METGSQELFCTLASPSEANLCLKQAWYRCLDAIEEGYPLWLSPLQEGHFELRNHTRRYGRASWPQRALMSRTVIAWPIRAHVATGLDGAEGDDLSSSHTVSSGSWPLLSNDAT